jgi:hypothetical protein
MTELEDGIRRALRARASEIQPPLPSLELGPGHAPGRVIRIAGHRFWTSAQLRWLAPAAAVVVVLALVAGGLLAHAELAPATTPAAQIQTTVPRYYVGITSGTHSQIDISQSELMLHYRATVATVRDTMTGAVLDRIRPPAPYLNFVAVSGATDDRTFVLVAAGKPGPVFGTMAERFYLLRINSAGGALLTPLAFGVSPGEQLDEIALSPAGTQLAVVRTDYPERSFKQFQDLYVYNLLTGSTRRWTLKACAPPVHYCPTVTPLSGPGGDGGNPIPGFPGAPVSLSWLSNGRSLALNIFYGYTSEVRLLNLAAPGRYVQPNSVPFGIHGIPVAAWTGDMTPDGSTVYASYVWDKGMTPAWVQTGLLRYSAATGKVAVVNKLAIRVANIGRTYPGDVLGWNDVLWTSYNGDVIIVAGARPGQSAGIYDGSQYTPLPWPRNMIDAAW